MGERNKSGNVFKGAGHVATDVRALKIMMEAAARLCNGIGRLCQKSVRHRSSHPYESVLRDHSGLLKEIDSDLSGILNFCGDWIRIKTTSHASKSNRGTHTL